MPRPRKSAAQLSRLLDGLAAPVYVLDDERRIVFCNEACASWLGSSVAELAGERCDYYTGGGAGLASVTGGLCPPPEVLAGLRRVAPISVQSSSGEVLSGRAEFIPIPDGLDGSAAVIVIVDLKELPNSPENADGQAMPSAEPNPIELHEELRRFRMAFAQRYGIDRMVGNSPAVRRVRSQVELASRSQVNVLVIGPPGSGKEHVARTIHYSRAQASPGALIPLACSALEPDLLSSTLKGLSARNIARLADKPVTVLLNDVDQLPPAAQEVLCGLMTTGELGVAVIGATIRPLMELVSEGQFRCDLAYQLSTLVIELPALAARLSDLSLLAQMFLEDANARGRHQVGGFTPEALDQLAVYGWPRNLDELAEMVANAHERATTHEVTMRDLPKRILLAADAARFSRRPEESIELEAFMARVEKELIARAMSRAKGNKTRAAKLLGLTRPRLYRKLVQMGLEKDISVQGKAPDDAH